MSDASLLICHNIKDVTLNPFDLLSIGIINSDFLQEFHLRLYFHLQTDNLLSHLKWDSIPRIELKYEESHFISDHILNGYITILSKYREEELKLYNILISFLIQFEIVWTLPIYQENNLEKINKRSYSHQVMKPIIDFIFHRISGIDIGWDGQSAEFMTNRNTGIFGLI